MSTTFRRAVIAVQVDAVVVVVGGVGATAFNPDSGKISHSLVLWRIFGIAAELGLLILFLLALVLVALAIGDRLRR